VGKNVKINTFRKETLIWIIRVILFMSFYNLIKDNCKIVKSPSNKLNILCCFCGRQIHSSTLFNWEEWDHDIIGIFNIIESKTIYHLLFKCKIKKLI
jgi:hypothetical protein